MKEGEIVSTIYQSIAGTFYEYDKRIEELVSSIKQRVSSMRQAGRLTPDVLQHILQYFKIKNIHYSNAIEGNVLDYGETQLVVERGLTITGKPLKDSLEARNLGHAMDFFKDLVLQDMIPITATDIRQVHQIILTDIDDRNAGKYRDVDVEITGSEFTQPPHYKIMTEMDEFCRWLTQVTSYDKTRPIIDPIIAAAVAHAWFVYIHPFVDGNGRTARILMNIVLIRYGYPIAVITKNDRQRYYEALEKSQASDLTPFISLLCDTVSESLDEYEKAVVEHQETVEWARSLVTQVQEDEVEKIKGRFEVWRSAMELFRGSFKQVAAIVNEQGKKEVIRFMEYDMIDFEKYLSLSQEKSAKRTWFFKIQFLNHCYLFFFGYASYTMKDEIFDNVTLHISREEFPFHYIRLDRIDSITPDLREIAYSQDEEQFVYRSVDNIVSRRKIEQLARDFITQIINIHSNQED